MEKTAGNVLNVMSQQSIQLSPDVNVATVLQRVSGVTMERDASGEASYAILRGMDKRYNYTLTTRTAIFPLIFSHPTLWTDLWCLNH